MGSMTSKPRSCEPASRNPSSNERRRSQARGALLLVALYRLTRRPPSDGAFIRIVVEPPRTSKKLLPALGGALARWVIERQLRNGGGALGLLGAALGEQRAPHGRAGYEAPREVRR